MMHTKPKAQEEQSIVESFKLLFYPEYPANASPEQFLSYYDPLFEQLKKLDLATEDQLKKMQVFCQPTGVERKEKIQQMQKIIFFIIDMLNNLCTHCHRKELRIRIIKEIASYKKNLANLAIGKQQTKISHWEKSFYTKPQNLQNIQQGKKQKLTTILDKIYLQYKRIPNYYMLFLPYPQILMNLYDFEEKIIFDSISDKTSMPLVHKYYLGIIAAATYGCQYLWNFMVTKFLKYGGDANWVKVGMDQIPEYLRKLGQVSYNLAYNFNVNELEQICFDMGKIIEDSAILEGFYILSYYQFLSCVFLVFGVVPQSTDYEKMYLPNVNNLKPSVQSFETMKKVSKKQFKYESEIARQFEQMYSWEVDSDKENYKRVELQLWEKKSSSSKRLVQKSNCHMINSSSSSQSTKDLSQAIQNELMVAFEEEEIIRKLKSSNTLRNIENIYGKYVDFDKRRSLIEFKRKSGRKTKNGEQINGKQESKEQENGRNQVSSSSEEQDDFIYASEWNFQNNASNLMEQTISHSFFTRVSELLKSLKFVEKQKSKNFKMYYESLQNYMYEYISYVNLINDGLSLAEKNYIKLLTRSPFLYNQRSFIKMKQDLESVCKICKPFRFGLEVFGYKLELAMSLGSYAYYRYLENK